MKGLAFLAIGKVGVIDKPIPEPGPNDAVIKTTASLICTSDVHVVRGVITIPERRLLGHESARECDALQRRRPGRGLCSHAMRTMRILSARLHLSMWRDARWPQVRVAA